MTKRMGQLLFWLPRVLGLLFALFVTVFALDVFGQGYGFWGTIVALLIHLIPVYVLLIALAIGWRWEWAGALLFIGITVWYLIEAWNPGTTAVNLAGILPIAVPPILIAFFFLLDWFFRRKAQAANNT